MKLAAVPNPPDPNTPTGNARYAIELEEFNRNTVERFDSLILLRAIRLAPALDVCEALLRGELVPRSALDPQWARAYHL